MPLSKVESLTYILITRGYIRFPRTRFCQIEYDASTELLVMLALYILGCGASFQSCQDMCNISTSEVRKNFHVFIYAIVDMRDDQVYMPRNRTELESVLNMTGYRNSLNVPDTLPLLLTSIVIYKIRPCYTPDPLLLVQL
jgi:hypothetical protein